MCIFMKILCYYFNDLSEGQIRLAEREGEGQEGALASSVRPAATALDQVR